MSQANCSKKKNASCDLIIFGFKLKAALWLAHSRANSNHTHKENLKIWWGFEIRVIHAEVILITLLTFEKDFHLCTHTALRNNLWIFTVKPNVILCVKCGLSSSKYCPEFCIKGVVTMSSCPSLNFESSCLCSLVVLSVESSPTAGWTNIDIFTQIWSLE